MTRTTPCGEPIEHELRVRDDGLPPVASNALTALIFLAVSLALGLRDGSSLRASLATAALAWAVFTVADLLRRRQRVWITAGEVVLRTWRGRTVRIPRASIAHVLHLRTPGSDNGLVTLLDDQDEPLLRFSTAAWSEETAPALLDVGRRSTVEDVLPEEHAASEGSGGVPATRTRRAAGAARLLLQGLLVAFSLACLVLALLLIAVSLAGA